MSAARLDCESTSPIHGSFKHRLGPMNPVRVYVARKLRVRGDQEAEPSLFARLRQFSRDYAPISSAEMAIDHAGVWRQVFDDCDGI